MYYLIEASLVSWSWEKRPSTSAWTFSWVMEDKSEYEMSGQIEAAAMRFQLELTTPPVFLVPCGDFSSRRYDLKYCNTHLKARHNLQEKLNIGSSNWD